MKNTRNADAATLALADNLFPATTSLLASRSVDQQLLASGGDAFTAQAFGGLNAAQVTKFALIGFIAGGGGLAVAVAVAVAASTVVISVVFAAAAFGILGQVISSNQSRLDAFSTCMDDVDICKTSPLDIGNSAGMALFGGLAASRSKLDLDLLQGVVRRSRTR